MMSATCLFLRPDRLPVTSSQDSTCISEGLHAALSRRSTADDIIVAATLSLIEHPLTH